MPRFNIDMLLITLLLIAALAVSNALPIDPSGISQKFRKSKADFSDLTRGAVGSDVYRIYSGDGSVESGWPAMDQWVSFQAMFDSNAELMKKACTDIFSLPLGSDTTNLEIAHIWDAIQSVADDTGVDHRFILAIMMQESGGCVRVYTTRNQNENPGLMQDHAGSHSCNRGSRWDSWGMVNPCPTDQISGMIRDGVGGTTAGDGLAELLNLAVAQSGWRLDGSSAQVYYQAARAYNSGQYDPQDLNNKFYSTKCYSMDIANRLTGWIFAPKQCFE